MINSFKGQFNDIARLNRFRVECDWFDPLAIVLNAVIPGQSWNLEIHRDSDHVGGVPINLPVDIIHNPSSITFINESRYIQKKMMDDWWARIFDPAPNQGFAYRDEYMKDIKIWALDRQGSDMYGVKLKDAFPSQISDISFDASADSGLSTFTATFVFADSVPI